MGVMDIYQPMKRIGATHTRREGDYIITYEVVGWNERAQCNTWCEKSRTYKPNNVVNKVIEVIEDEIETTIVKNIRKKLS